ncbi:MAG: nucleoside triphosphate pyrophosphohydrolase [Parasphingopyxis sp.]
MKHAGEAIQRLTTIMARLRDPDRGCPWDLEQDFASIAPYTIEEAYEVADAIERDDLDALCDELGDLQLQVVFHARMAEEAGAFALSDVIRGIADKMVRRHPHVFGGDEEDTSKSPNWEAIKAEERAAEGQAGALDGVARALPALLRAQKLQKRAAGTGFDWPDASGPRAKVDEEIAELDDARNESQIIEEMGDLLFAIVNWARHLGIDAEAALLQANTKFERRFAAIESAGGSGFAALSLEEKEALWQAAKR